jgi:uncharacterized membrane protein
MTVAAAARAGTVSRDAVLAYAIRIIALVAIVAGFAVRFDGLDHKLFSYDEATTSLRTAGYTLSDYYGEAFGGAVVPNAVFSSYQHVTPAKSAADMVRSLAVEDPQHPPLYYAFERGWSQVFGNTVSARRTVSAIAGTLMVGAVFWLALELFGSLDAALITAALLAVSPFFVIYSQQAREYTLWGFFVAVSSALLVRALRGRTIDWMWYAVATTLGLYSDLIFLYVLPAHALYVAILAVRKRKPRWAIGFAAAAAAAVAAFGPWLLATYRGRALLTNNDYLGAALPAKVFALKWIFNIGAVFFDLDYQHVALAAVLVPLFALILLSFAVMLKAMPIRIWALPLVLAATTALAFLAPDLLHHESRSTVARYMLPAWLALELSVAGLLAYGLLSFQPYSRRLAGALAFCALIVCGVASVSADARSETSWAEGKSIAGLGPISRIIDAAPHPTVVYISDPARFDFASLALSNELRADAGIQQLPLARGVARISTAPGTFVLDPTPRVLAALASAGIVLHEVYADDDAAAPAAIATLRAQTAAVRRSQGEADTRLTLWSVDRSGG